MGFAVTRTSKSLVVPTSPTPAGETLRLSSLDRVPGLRHLVLSLHAFDGATRVEAAVGEGEVAASPARVVREALGKALVDYYPFAGRFLEPEVEGGEVRVACTGEGAWFVEAMAACSLEARLAGDVARWAVGGFAQDPYELRFTYDSLFVSDWTRLGFLEADYGWGAPTHVVPFSYHPFMAVAVIGAPPAPKIGARVMTMCVEEAHLPEFRDQMNAFAAGK
ncbi:unnamed protein product [Triticum turgidum subsp. durum]|uniref:Uncharacterized protein n=1 Tax=Triticum turgidum subsp. durum TaxID=4567 RepID=A0A9R0V308_TRITD|nr:unnamed protein product [Triticum turgidum subsp. durum]